MSSSDNSDNVFLQLGKLINNVTLVIAIIFCYYPYKYYSGYRDILVRAIYQDDVWVVEENWRVDDQKHFNYCPPEFKIIHDVPLNKGVLAEYPFLTDKKNPSRKTYFHGHSLDEAVKWALDRGYKKARFQTVTHSKDHDEKYYVKWFLVKHINNEVVSILSLVVDYGDSNIYRYPYRTDPEYPGFNLVDVPTLENEEAAFKSRKWATYQYFGWASTNYITDSLSDRHNENTGWWYPYSR